MNPETLKKIWLHAKDKVTTYVGLGIVGLAQLSEHVEDIYAQVPQLEPLLPPSPHVHTTIRYIVSALGIAVAITRVRRLVWPKPQP